MPSEEGPNVSGVPDLRVETTGGEVFIVGEVKGELLTKRTKEASECQLLAAVLMANKTQATRIVGLRLDPREIAIYVPCSNNRFKTVVLSTDSLMSLLEGIDVALG